MRILVVTQYFYPENFKSNDIAFELVKRGYRVDVLSGIPNYPDGRYFKGYGVFNKRREIINGVRVFRAFQIARGVNHKWRLALNYLSYAFFSSIWALFLSVFNKYDCIIVHAPSPITQGFAAVLVKKIQRIPLYLWILDLWPEAIVSGGGIKNKYILGIVDTIVKFMYNNSDKILISSEEFEPYISAKGNYKEKIEYFPNWSQDLLNIPDEYPIPALPDGFIVMIAGNLGVSQNLEALIGVAKEMAEEKNIKWVLVGDGSKKKWLDDSIIENNLQGNVFTLGRFSSDAMPSFFKVANAMLLTLSGEFPDLKLVVPARLQSYMAAGRPVLAMIDGAGSELIRKANCGYSVNSGDYVSLARVIREKVFPDLESFENLGTNGRKYFEKYFHKDICIDHLCEIIKKN